MSKNEEKIKHLEFIQLAIVRMAANSFLLKGWTVTISASLFALAAKDTDPRFLFIGIFAAMAFWGLDAYYLRQERLFRELYDDVRKKEDASAKDRFSMSTEKYLKNVHCWVWTLFSPSVIALHGMVLAVLITFALLANGDKISLLWRAERFSVFTTGGTLHGQTSSETVGSPKTEKMQGSGTLPSGSAQSETETTL